MGLNSRYEQRSQRDQLRSQLREMRCQNLRHFRTRVRRAEDGKVLGVFKGIANSMGWSVCMTRIFGTIALLGLSSIFGIEGFKATLLAWGFLYLFLAMLMGPTRPASELEAQAPAGSPAFGEGWRSGAGQPPPFPATGGVRTVGGSASESAARSAYAYRQRVDLAGLDQRLESLNRRIRRMESVVTDPGYDWERRLGK